LLERFTGYLIAPCGFQLANVLAIINDAGIRNLAIEYLDWSFGYQHKYAR